MKIGGCDEGLWERLRDEDEELWEQLRDVRKVERWEMKMGACAEDEDWETWARKVESENGG
jgi:hypothetical protein